MKMPSKKAPRTFDREGHNARYWTPIPGGIAERAVNAMRQRRITMITANNELKDVARQADQLSREALCLIEELHDLLIDIEEGDIDEGLLEEVKATFQDVEAMSGAIGRWRSSLTQGGGEDEGESASVPA
jgi:hypothetical protein